MLRGFSFTLPYLVSKTFLLAQPEVEIKPTTNISKLQASFEPTQSDLKGLVMCALPLCCCCVYCVCASRFDGVLEFV